MNAPASPQPGKLEPGDLTGPVRSSKVTAARCRATIGTVGVVIAGLSLFFGPFHGGSPATDVRLSRIGVLVGLGSVQGSLTVENRSRHPVTLTDVDVAFPPKGGRGFFLGYLSFSRATTVSGRINLADRPVVIASGDSVRLSVTAPISSVFKATGTPATLDEVAPRVRYVDVLADTADGRPWTARLELGHRSGFPGLYASN
jgi:hypothetical protein